MKITILKLSTFFLIFNLLNGCDWMYDSPVTDNVWLYKTKGDYRHLYTIRLSDEKESGVNLWTSDKTLWSGLNKDTVYRWRHKAANGYVISGPAKLSDVYLSLTYKEVLLKEIAMNNPGKPLPNDTLWEYILDTNPYLEFYRCTTTFGLEDSIKINEIIRNDQIE